MFSRAWHFKTKIIAKLLARQEESTLDSHKSVVEILLKQKEVTFAATSLNAILFFTLSWTRAELNMLLIWLISILAFGVFRYKLMSFFESKINTNSEDDYKKTLSLLTLASFISGIFWGILGANYLNFNSTTQFILTIFILAGLTAGSVGTSSIWRPIVRAFMFSSLMPVIINLFLHNYIDLGFLTIFFVICMDRISLNINTQLTKIIKLQDENKTLLERFNSACHEIKTPIASIIGFSELLTSSNLNDKDRLNYLQIILRNAKRLKGTVENTLAYSTVGQKKETNKQPLSIRRELKEISECFKKTTDEKNISLELYFSEDLPEDLYCNLLCFRQVMTNILSNAVKYTKKGAISIKSSMNSNAKQVMIEVSDTGIGIEAGAVASVFTPFYRETRSEVQMQEGTGLGLGLARKLAQSMGGDLKLIKTQVNVGTIFLFSFNVNYADKPLLN